MCTYPSKKSLLAILAIYGIIALIGNTFTKLVLTFGFTLEIFTKICHYYKNIEFTLKVYAMKCHYYRNINFKLKNALKY